MEDYRQWIAQANDTGSTWRERHAAFARLIKQFHALAYAYALADLGNRQAAEDVAQESFITAWVELGKLREPATFPNWLKRIVSTHCHRVHRRNEPPSLPLDFAHKIADESTAPHAAAELNELRREVRSQLLSLSESERIAVTLFYIGGYSYSDLTEFLDVPLSTVKKRLHTARGRLRERMTTMLKDVIQEDKPSGDQIAQRLELFTAIKTGDIERVRELLRDLPNLIDAGMADSFGIASESPLIAAIRADKADIVTLLIDRGIRPAQSDVREAALYGRRPIARELIDAGGLASSVAELETDIVELIKAVYAGDTAWIASVIDRSSSVVSGADGSGRTPLMIAADVGYVDVAALLLDRGADIDAVDSASVDALHHAANASNWCYPGHPRVVELLVERGASCDIFTAARSGSVSIVRAMVEEKPDLVNATTADGATPLEIAVAAFAGHTVVDYLREKPQQMNIWTACQFGNVDRVRELLKENPALADMPRKNAGDKTPVHYTAQNWCPQEVAAQIIDLLAENGADVNYRESGAGWRPLHAVAEWWNDTQIAEALLRHGAEINPRSNAGWTPLRYAVALGREKMVQFLRERGAEE